MTPTVSVIVTCYNYGRYVGAALESVRRQSLTDFEALVIDDGSTDDSLRVIDGFLKDRRFRLIRQDHAGQPRTKNRGLAEARAPFIAFLDADDTWAPTKLEKQVARFRKDRSLGVVYTRRTLIDANGRVRSALAVWTPGVLVGRLGVPGGPTPYMRLGDWPGTLAFVTVGVFVILAARKGAGPRGSAASRA